jgi:hypothetical protein
VEAAHALMRGYNVFVEMSANETKRNDLVEEFTKAFLKALDDEKTELEKIPRVHNIEKGEYLHEVDPAEGDKFLKD